MPQTPAVRKRRFVVSFHVDENELSFLNRQVAASSLNREEYLRTLIVGKEIHPRPCTHHADLLRKVVREELQTASIATAVPSPPSDDAIPDSALNFLSTL